MLASLNEVIGIGKKKNIAIGAFNTPNLECVLAVLGCAEELGVPVIISHAQCHEGISHLDDIGPVMVLLASRSKAKVCVHLDHGEDIDYCKRAIALGFTSVMIDNSTKSYEENVRLTREVVDYAHTRRIDVEAELGRLPSREGESESRLGKPENLYTDPELVLDYLARTKVDALAIAFGTAHGIYKVKPVLDFDIIAKVRAKTSIPLVMHGGSGISADEYRQVIKLGINKINYYTYMSFAGYASAKALLEKQDKGFYHDLAFAAQKGMHDDCMKAMSVFSGK